MKRKVKYQVCVEYRVFDFIDVTLNEDQSENDAIYAAECVSFDKSLDDMVVDYVDTRIVEREYV